MGDHWPSSLHNPRGSKAEGRSEGGQDDDALGPRSTAYESRGSKDLDGRGQGSPDQEEEVPPEEVTGEAFLDPQDPEDALQELERVLQKDEHGVQEMSRLSITQRSPGTATARGRRKRRRLFELAKPKPNWQVLRDRLGCRCKGFAWISPCMKSLQFCVYWPSTYWTDRFLEDTTLTVTVPAVSRRVEELARPKRFYLDYDSGSRTTSVWPIPKATLVCQPSSRLRELATPRVRNNIWSINMSEVSQVSRAAQKAVPSPRILQLAKPRAAAPLLAEWDPVLKPKPYVSDYNRLVHLAMPKAQSDKCVPDRDPRWEVLDVTKRAVASPRIVSLAQPKVRRDLNEGYDRRPLASASSPPPRVSPEKCERPRPGLRDPVPSKHPSAS
ncbi:PREDICTED: testicular haploid expressed gene protein [Ceratotherium simum simum]|uniref:Testicular haploid expressed gene protein n=1 Tax=Ceratotherium simum simum TaxID=73337 RepID=A0ABM1DI45_CERSS|nr:PREDICTED: testicular haploid expressed gene protein [Ceratotherium simum simum]